MYSENQNNEAYVENFLKKAPASEKDKMLKILNEYGDDKWWFSDNPEVIVRHQIGQSFLIIEFNKFWKALQNVLGRPVSLKELDPDKIDRLKEEVKEKLSK